MKTCTEIGNKCINCLELRKCLDKMGIIGWNDTLFLPNGKEFLIDEIKDGIIYGRIIRKVTILFNDRKDREEQVLIDSAQYEISSIGDSIYIDAADKLLDYNELLEKHPYNALKPLIYKHIQEKIALLQSRMNVDIDLPVLTDIDKEKLIFGYDLRKEQIIEDAPYKKNCFARMDFDTVISFDNNRLKSRRFLKVYISELEIGEEKILEQDDYVWKIPAGLVVANKGATIDVGFVRMQVTRWYYLDGGMIIDWRAPLAALYYENDKTNLCLPSTPYSFSHELLLKRRFSSNSYDDLFVNGKSLYAHGAVDPFLLSVLKKKKNQEELSDIITTIQENQYAIIRQDLKKHIIVQGCAGSGKTMIMLHRITYLLYNYPEIKNNIVIITPNEEFNHFIAPVLNRLKIKDDFVFTLDSYYLLWLRRFNYAEDQHPNLNMQSVFNNNFVHLLETTYNDYCTKLRNDIEVRVNKNISDKKTFLANKLFDFLLKAQNTVASIIKDCSAERMLITSLRKWEELFVDLKEKEKQLLFMIKTKYRVMGIADSLVHSCETVSPTVAQSLRDKKETIMLSPDELLPRVVQDYRTMENNGLLFFRLFNFQHNTAFSFLRPKMQDSSDETIMKRICAIINKKIKANKLILSETLYHDYKEKILNEKIKNSKGVMVPKYESYCTLYERGEITPYQLTRFNRIILDIVFPEYIRKNIVANTEVYLHDKNSLLHSVQRDTTLSKNIDINLNMSCATIIEKICQCLKGLPTINKVIHDLEWYNSLSEELSSLAPHNVLAQVIDLMPAEFSGANNSLFVKVLFCSLFFNIPSCRESHLFIDEGQDISLAEYELLARLNNKSTFNIYGDINQSIYKKNAQFKWEKIKQLFEFDQFALNENYRNTIETTEFCNKEFGFAMLPIGIDGENVSILEKKDFIASLPASPSCIIVSTEYQKSEEGALFCNMLAPHRIMTVEEVKGLEFKAVWVIPHLMTKNEYYIAATRTLGSLYICK